MPQLRKTLGDIHSEICIQLMRLIETQSRETLARWASGYARESYLLLCRETCPDLEPVVIDCLVCAEQGTPAACYRNRMWKAAILARTCCGPAEQAAARAVAAACAVMQTPSNALGFLFYGAAAVAYGKDRLDTSQAECDAMAAEELRRAYESLSACAVSEETNPAKIRWNC